MNSFRSASDRRIQDQKFTHFLYETLEKSSHA